MGLNRTFFLVSNGIILAISARALVIFAPLVTATLSFVFDFTAPKLALLISVDFLLGTWVAWYEELRLELVQSFEKYYQFVGPFFLLWQRLVVVVSALVSLVHVDALEFTIINIPIHAESLLADLLYLLQHIIVICVVATFAVLVHNVFAEPIVPGLQFVLDDLIVKELTFDMPVSVQTRSIVANNNVICSIDVSVAKVDSIVVAVANDVVFKFAP